MKRERKSWGRRGHDTGKGLISDPSRDVKSVPFPSFAFSMVTIVAR